MPTQRLITLSLFGWLAESVQTCPLNVTVKIFQRFGPDKDDLQHSVFFSRDESIIGTATAFMWHHRGIHDLEFPLALANQVFVIRLFDYN